MMDKNTDSELSRRRITVQVILDVVIWLSVALPVLYVFVAGVPYERGFFCDDDSLKYPDKSDTISTSVLIITGFAASMLVVVYVEVVQCIDRRCRRTCQPADDVLFGLKGYSVFLVGFVITELVVEVVKNKMGVLRPNFFDVCKPAYNESLCDSYITEYRCIGNEHDASDLLDIRRSFPSGHAAFSMYISAYFCLYMERRMQISFSQLLKPMSQTMLVFTSLLCGLTRIRDNKHHPSDVIGGILIGILVALVVYKTLGQRVLTSERVTRVKASSIPMINKTNCCCASAHTPEATEISTPAPLLQNECTQNHDNGTAVTLKNGPFHTRRHTMPTTSNGCV